MSAQPTTTPPEATAGNPGKRLLTISELSEAWRVPVPTLYNWVYRNKIPYLKLGRLLRFDPEAIEQHCRRSTIGTAGKR